MQIYNGKLLITAVRDSEADKLLDDAGFCEEVKTAIIEHLEEVDPRQLEKHEPYCGLVKVGEHCFSFEIEWHASVRGAVFAPDCLVRKEAQHSIEARQIAQALREFAKHPDAIDNFESYLSHHFGAWLEKYAETPERMAGEFLHFASIREEEVA